MKNLNFRSEFRPASPVRKIFFVTLLLAAGYLHAQLPDIRISIDVSNKPAEDVMENISLQAGYYFTYNAGLLPAKSRVTLTVRDLPLETVLDSVFRDTSLEYTLIDKNIVIYRKNRLLTGLPGIDTVSFRRIRGEITDARSGKSLPYATIALFETNMGTISNETGEFILNIPANIENPVLVVSFIGYRNQYRPLSLPATGEVRISMNKDMVSLQEVIIRYQDPAAILYEAIRRIPENYTGDFSLMSAYYRENVQRNKKFLLFSEAALDILKQPYSSTSSDDRVKIVKGRKFQNIDDEDTVLMKIKSGIRSSLQLDIVKSLPYFLAPDSRHLYDFDLSDIVSYKNTLVYVIGFRQKPQVKDALYTGEIYIDMENLAILAADFKIDPRYIGQETNTFVIRKSPRMKIRPLSAEYHTEYRKSDGKYHLSQVRGEVRFKMRKRKKWIGSLYSLKIEMAVTDVESASRRQLRSNEIINTGMILSDQKFTADPEFWGNYNTIEPEASLTEILNKMGKQLPW